MTRQFTKPLLVTDGIDGASFPLERIALSSKSRGEYDEAWLQQLLFTRPELLPIEDISRNHSEPMALCREMETGAGPVDLVYINEHGLLTLVECKLWRNPESRREVVGQILEYAAHITGWTYDKLRDAVCAARHSSGDPVRELVAAQTGNLDEHSFIDDVQKCLDDGRFLLLVVGDGIRQNVLNIAELLRRQAGLSFTFGLVEVAIFRLPAAGGGGLLVQPRLLAQSVEIIRELSRQSFAQPATITSFNEVQSQRVRLTDLEIRQRLRAVDPGLPDMVFNFLERCRIEGLYISTRRSLMIHHVSENGSRFNLGTFYYDGDVNTNYIVSDTEKIGDCAVGEFYLAQVASLIPRATVLRMGNNWTWRVVVNGRLPRAMQLLQRADNWLAIIVATRDALRALENRQENTPS